MNPELKEKLRISANQFYLNKYMEYPLITDKEYDQLETMYEAEGGSVKDLIEWDSDLTFLNEPMEGLDKSVIEDNNLASAATDYISNISDLKEYDIFPKYDGSSIKIYYEEGKLKKILGTPEESYGIIRTKAFWDLVPHELEDKSIVSLQGEVLVDASVYGQLARNKANGLTNSKHMDSEVTQDAFLRIYGVRFKDEGYNYIKAKKVLSTLPEIKLTRSRKVGQSELGEDIFQNREDVVFKAAESLDIDSIPVGPILDLSGHVFQVDGIVLYSEQGVKGLKFYYTESETTTITDINYDIKHNGSYAATLNFDPIILNDKNIGAASTGGIPNLMYMKMGIGAKVRVILSGSTIPKVVEVIEESENYQFPKCECGYQLTEDDIYGSVLKCGETGLCEMKYGLFYNELYSELNHENTTLKDWLSNNFLNWMTFFKVDRWNPWNKCLFETSSKEYKELVEAAIELLTEREFHRLTTLIGDSFAFSELQWDNFQINACSMMEASWDIFNNVPNRFEKKKLSC